MANDFIAGLHQIAAGVTSGGVAIPLLVDTDGKAIISGGGGGGGTVDQGAAGASPWKVDDDASQLLLALLLTESTFVGRVGEVQTTPTANTILDRLKALATILGEVQTSPTANTLLARVKTLATLLAGGLPASLSTGGALKVALVDFTTGNTVNNITGARPTINQFIDENGVIANELVYFGRPASSGDNQLVAANATKKIRVLHYRLQGSGAVNAKFRSATTDISMLWEFEAREGVAAAAITGGYEFETVANQALNLNLSGAVPVNVQVGYILV